MRETKQHVRSQTEGHGRTQQRTQKTQQDRHGQPNHHGQTPWSNSCSISLTNLVKTGFVSRFAGISKPPSWFFYRVESTRSRLLIFPRFVSPYSFSTTCSEMSITPAKYETHTPCVLQRLYHGMKINETHATHHSDSAHYPHVYLLLGVHTLGFEGELLDVPYCFHEVKVDRGDYNVTYCTDRL